MHANRRNKKDRRAVVAAEFAVVAPLLMTVVLGMIEIGRAFEVQQQLFAAARDGARFAAMDKDGILGQGQSTNDKIIQDVRNFLTASGLPGDQAIITIKHHDNPSSDFNLDDPNNSLELFRLKAELPYALVSVLPPKWVQSQYLAADVVFRNSRGTVVQ